MSTTAVSACPSGSVTDTMTSSASPSGWVTSTASGAAVALDSSVSHDGSACARSAISCDTRRRSTSSRDRAATAASSALVSGSGASRKEPRSCSRVGRSGSGWNGSSRPGIDHREEHGGQLEQGERFAVVERVGDPLDQVGLAAPLRPAACRGPLLGAGGGAGSLVPLRHGAHGSPTVRYSWTSSSSGATSPSSMSTPSSTPPTRHCSAGAGSTARSTAVAGRRSSPSARGSGRIATPTASRPARRSPPRPDGSRPAG